MRGWEEDRVFDGVLGSGEGAEGVALSSVSVFRVLLGENCDQWRAAGQTGRSLDIRSRTFGPQVLAMRHLSSHCGGS